MYYKSEDINTLVIDGEAVLINLKSGVYYGLDCVGLEIWELLELKKDITYLTEEIKRKFNTADSFFTIKNDIETFLEGLLAKGLVTKDDQ